MKDMEEPAAGGSPLVENREENKDSKEVGSAGESTTCGKSNDVDVLDRQGDYKLLEELLNKPTDNAGSHLDILLDFIAESPQRVSALGTLGSSSKSLKGQVHERLQKHKEHVAKAAAKATAEAMVAVSVSFKLQTPSSFRQRMRQEWADADLPVFGSFWR